METIKIDISTTGSFSTLTLAKWCLNERFYGLCQLNGCNYQVKCLIDGKPIFLDYEYQESDEPLRIMNQIINANTDD